MSGHQTVQESASASNTKRKMRDMDTDKNTLRQLGRTIQ